MLSIERRVQREYPRRLGGAYAQATQALVYLRRAVRRGQLNHAGAPIVGTRSAVRRDASHQIGRATAPSHTIDRASSTVTPRRARPASAHASHLRGPAHFVPLIPGHLELRPRGKPKLRPRHEIIEARFAGDLLLQEPPDLVQRRLGGVARERADRPAPARVAESLEPGQRRVACWGLGRELERWLLVRLNERPLEPPERNLVAQR